MGKTKRTKAIGLKKIMAKTDLRLKENQEKQKKAQEDKLVVRNVCVKLLVLLVGWRFIHPCSAGKNTLLVSSLRTTHNLAPHTTFWLIRTSSTFQSKISLTCAAR